MKNRNYYTLVGSLPYLPRFDKAERLPITRERLVQRLRMLDPEDFKVADKATSFLDWRRQPIGRTNAEIVAIYNKNLEEIFESPLLKPLFEFPVNQRTLLTALRRKEAGMPCPNPLEPWGAGPLVKTIESNWSHPFFKLNGIFPWMIQAQAYLRSGETLKLEYLLINLYWDKLDRVLLKNIFCFEAVIAYILKWDLLHQWLSYNKEAANKRFNTLVLETIHEYQA